MQNKILNIPSAYLSTLSLTTMGFNLLNAIITTLTPGGVGFVGTQPYALVKHIRLSNVLSTSAVVVTLYKGTILSSASNNAYAFDNVSLPAQSFLDYVSQDRFDADYLSGIASLPQAVVITIAAEIGLA